MVPDPSSEATPQLDFEREEQRLQELPNMELLGLLRHSSNYTYLARLSAGQDSLLAVYKPAAGDWPLIPATVVRDQAPEGKGSLQLFIDADPRNHFLRIRDVPAVTWARVAVFDVITNNADRKAGHLVRDDKGRVW